jgi:hypothetical protein
MFIDSDPVHLKDRVKDYVLDALQRSLRPDVSAVNLSSSSEINGVLRHQEKDAGGKLSGRQA